MISQSNAVSITACFTIAPADMPRLSTPTEAPSYTSIKNFREKLKKKPWPSHQIKSNATWSPPPCCHEYNEASNNTPFRIPTDPGPSAPNPITTTNNNNRRSTRVAGNDPPENEPTTNTATTETEIQYNMLPYTAA